MQHEVEGAAEVFHSAVHERAEIFEARGISGNQLAAVRVGEFLQGTHPQRQGRIREDDVRAFGDGPLGHLPGDGLVIEGTGDDAFLSFQQFHLTSSDLCFPSGRMKARP